MTDPIRWTSMLAVAWNPLLTYERRRLELLEWIEANANPKAFLDEKDRLGVAIGSMAQRIRVDRRSLLMQLGSRSATADSLSAVAQGVFDVFEPREPVLRNYRGLWSLALDSDYSETAERLASRAALLGPSPVPSGMIPVDGAILIDLVSKTGKFQVEFGIVGPEELRLRVGQKVHARTGGGGDSGLLSAISVPADLPPVSLYMDVFLSAPTQHAVTADDLAARYEEVETQVTNLTREIGAAL